MFIIWGTKGFEVNLGYTNISTSCPHCNNEVTLLAKKMGRKFTLFWIPLFPIESSYYILCPICSAGKKVSRAEAEQYLGSKVN
jgi:hypothetical protein